MQQEIFPLLEARGFRPLKHTGLWYEFVRQQADQLQQIEIQWDKYHRPGFAINFGQTPVVMRDGETGYCHHLTGEWIPLAGMSSGLAQYNLLTFGHFRRRFFRYTWLASLLPSGGPHTTIERAIAFLPLVDSWFAGDPASIAIVDRMNSRDSASRPENG